MPVSSQAKPSAEDFHLQLPPLHIDPINIGDFQLPAGGRFQLGGNLDHLIVEEVQSGHGVVRFRLGGFLDERNCVALLIDFHDAITLRIFHHVGEDRRSALARAARRSMLWKPWP